MSSHRLGKVEVEMRRVEKSKLMSGFLVIMILGCHVLQISVVLTAGDSASPPSMLPSEYGSEQGMGTLGGKYSDDLRLANASSQSQKPRIAVDDSNIHVVFEEARDGNFEIYYKRSTDSGLTWTKDIRLTNNAEISKLPSIAVNGSNVHVVWSNWAWKDYLGDSSMELFYKRSEDNGVTWTPDIQLTDVFDGIAEWATIAVNGSNVHVMWSDARDRLNWEIYYMRSVDNGYTWSNEIRLTNDPSYSGCPETAVNGSNIHVIWSDSRLGAYEVFYKKSIDNGMTWSTDMAISNLDGRPTYAESIEVYGNTVHVAMTDDRFTVFPDMNYEIYYRRSTDNGNTWDNEVRLTDALGDQDAADVAVNQSNIFVMWQDNRTGTRQIYFKKSTDNGKTWETDVQITSGEENSLWPELSTNNICLPSLWAEITFMSSGTISTEVPWVQIYSISVVWIMVLLGMTM